MRPESRKLLLDMSEAADKIAAFTQGKSQDDFLKDDALQWTVERGFEIIGEALSQLKKLDVSLAERITDHRKIISFRNVLIHAYSQISDTKTWSIVENNLPVLRREMKELFGE